MTASHDPALRALVGGVLWPGFLGRTAARRGCARELDDGGLAGAVLFAHNLGDERRADVPRGRAPRHPPGRCSSASTRRAATSPASRRPTGSTLPGAAQLGFVDDVAVTEAPSGGALAERSLAVGANVVLGPVADVNTDPRNPVIGVRAFGDDARARRRGTSRPRVRGIQSAGAAACVKHFPGHGDTHVDSHHALPTLTIGLDELERVHLPPFRAAIDAGVAMP